MTQKRLELDYEDLSKHFKVIGGDLVRLVDSKHTKAGDVVGSLSNEGYLRFGHNGNLYAVHRAIYLLTHGNLPRFIDHINGIKSDNRPENLREASNSQNCCNSKISVKNTSGVKGVHKLKNGKGYQGSITLNGKRKFLGVFETLELADEFVSLARDMVHGKFANTGVRL
jgi:hypothetical protein